MRYLLIMVLFLCGCESKKTEFEWPCTKTMCLVNDNGVASCGVSCKEGFGEYVYTWRAETRKIVKEEKK